MDNSTSSHATQSKLSIPILPNPARRSKNDQKWEAHKSEIYNLYIEENNTLPGTMAIIQERHGLKASLRKWKTKIRDDWGFEKNFSSQDLQILVAKAEKREREEGKETVSWHAGNMISPARLSNFKKRKIVRTDNDVLESAVTPEGFAYNTPSPDEDFQEWDDLEPREPESFRSREASPDDRDEWSMLDSDGEVIKMSRLAHGAHVPVMSPALSTERAKPSLTLVIPDEGSKSIISEELNLKSIQVSKVNDWAEEARINSVVWKGYRAKEDDKAPDVSFISIHEEDRLRNEDGVGCRDLRNLKLLADMHYVNGRLAEAADAYYRAIVGYEKSERCFEEEILTTAHSLTRVLKDQKEYREAETLLLYIFGFCLRKSRSHSCHQPWDRKSAVSRHIINILTSLEEIYTHPLETSTLEVRVGLGDLITALKLLSGCRLDSHFPHAWFAITRLAAAYTAKEDLSSAHLLFSYSIPVLQELDDILYGTKKTNAFLGYSLNLQRRREWGESARMLMLALETVTQMDNQDMIPKDDYEPLLQLVLFRWNGLLHELRDQGVNESVVTPMKRLIESKRPQLEHRQPRLDVAAIEMASLKITRAHSLHRLPALTEVSEKDGTSSMSSKSYKYGVTYSSSSITGVSNSIFLVP